MIIICHNIYKPGFNKIQQKALLEFQKQFLADFFIITAKLWYRPRQKSSQLDGKIFSSLCYRASVYAKSQFAGHLTLRW